MSSMDITQATTSCLDDTQGQTITESENYAQYQQFSLEETIAQLKIKLSDILCRFEEQQQKIRLLKLENAKIQEQLTNSAFAEESTDEALSDCGDDSNDELGFLNTIMKTFIDDAIWLKVLNEDTKKGVLKIAKGEIEKVLLAVQVLENLSLEKQKLLKAYSEQNEKLKERLVIVKLNFFSASPMDHLKKQYLQFYNRRCGKCFGGDQQIPATGILQLETSNRPSIVVDSFSLVLKGGNPLTIKFNEAGDLPNVMFCVEEGQQYMLRMNLIVHKSLKELRYVHCFKKLRMRWLSREFSLGSLTPQSDVQSIALPFRNAPQGLLHRGKYKVKSKLLGENNFEYAKWNWILKIVKSSSKKALVLH